MQRLWIASMTTIACLGLGTFPVWIPGNRSAIAMAETVQKPKVNLELIGEKRVATRDPQGRESVTWQKVGPQVTAQPGDILRYTLKGSNVGQAPANKLSLLQAIPQGTVYAKDSATKQAGVEITFSIDGGKNFAANPMVEVKTLAGQMEIKPAPLEMYTHVRWQWQTPVAPGGQINVAYQVRVK